MVVSLLGPGGSVSLALVLDLELVQRDAERNLTQRQQERRRGNEGRNWISQIVDGIRGRMQPLPNFWSLNRPSELVFGGVCCMRGAVSDIMIIYSIWYARLTVIESETLLLDSLTDLMLSVMSVTADFWEKKHK